MSKNKVCRICKCIVEESVEECPNCQSKGQWNLNYQGRVRVFDTKSSYIGERIGAKVKGEYAIKSRS
jgi:RNA polymerase subunit RPABC4/transcription elongation factor Spt4